MQAFARSFLAAVLILASLAAEAAEGNFAQTVLQLRARRADGSVHFGSAVLVALGRVITNCHVTRHAARIQLSRGGEEWIGKPEREDWLRDLCLLSVPEATGPVAVLGGTGLAVGEPVSAVGYPGGGEQVLSEGQVKALHPHQGAHVIQGSAPFAEGASGGGLFDRQGRLVGILTFKSPRGGDFHFALPVEWVKEALAAAESGAPSAAAGDTTAFWQRTGPAQPYFLRAAACEAQRNWKGLLAVAREWRAQEPGNPQPWVAASKAARALTAGEEVALVGTSTD